MCMRGLRIEVDGNMAFLPLVALAGLESSTIRIEGLRLARC